MVVLFPDIARGEPTSYVQGDVIGGFAPPGGATVLGAIEGGYRVSPHWWTRAELAYGAAFGIDPTGSGHGSNEQARVGAEARWCSERGTICGNVGVDLGVHHGTYVDNAVPTATDTFTAAIVVPRAGVDVGGRHVRARVAIELGGGLASGSSGDVNDVYPALVGGVAYQW